MLKLYPVRDRIPMQEAEELGLDKSRGMYSCDVMAVKTGEFREPKSGEWYLSGAIPEAYKTRNQLSTKYHIMKIVRVETKTVTKAFR